LDGCQALRLSRIANHIFYALRAVILTVGGLDIHPSSEQQTFNDTVLLGSSSQWLGDTNESPREEDTEEPINDQFSTNTLQERIQASLTLLNHFSAAKCRTASRALQLVEHVFSKNDSLAAKFGIQKRKENEVSTSDTSNRESYNFNETFDSFQELFDTDSLSLFESPVNDVLLQQSPQQDLLTLHGIDTFLAGFNSNLV